MRRDFSREYDVVVAGGGIAGVAAALAAARQGARTALVEKSVLWGGLATSGIVFMYLPLCDGNGTQVTFGIAEELLKISMKYGPGTIPDWKNGRNLPEHKRYRVIFSPAAMVLGLDELLQASGCDLWLDTVVADVTRVDRRIESLTVVNKSGIGVLHGKVMVDATGDADLAFLAGADCPTAANSLAIWTIEYVADGGGSLAPHLRAAIVGGSVDPNSTGPGVNGRMVSEFVMQARAKYRAQLQSAYDSGVADRFTRFPVKIPAMADLRHTRRIDGLFTLDNGMEWQTFDDAVGVCADWRQPGKVWEIPYRSLLTRELDNLIAAGRCIASHDDAWEVTRVIPVAALTGEAAGIAAGLAVKSAVAPPDLAVSVLQDAMRETGNPVCIAELYPPH